MNQRLTKADPGLDFNDSQCIHFSCDYRDRACRWTRCLAGDWPEKGAIPIADSPMAHYRTADQRCVLLAPVPPVRDFRVGKCSITGGAACLMPNPHSTFPE